MDRLRSRQIVHERRTSRTTGKWGFSNSDIEKMINVAKGGEGNLPFFNGKCGKDSQFFATAYQGSDRWKNWYGGEKLNMKPFHMGL